MKRHFLSQLLILLQAGTIVGLGIALVGPFTSAFNEYSNPLFILRSSGSAIASAIFFRALPQAILRTMAALALLWWLSEQKRLLSSREGDIVFQLTRKRKVIALAVALGCLVACFLFLRTKSNTVVFSERDIQSTPAEK